MTNENMKLIFKKIFATSLYNVVWRVTAEETGARREKGWNEENVFVR